MKPRNVRTESQQAKLQRDNKCSEEGWILVDASRGTVTLCKQRAGGNSEGMTVLPREDFNALIDWYNRDQAPKRPRRR